MKKRIAGPIVACINVIEPLEDRRLFAVSLAATALLAPQPNALVASSPTSGTGTGGGIITPTPIPPAPTNDTTVPVTIHAAAGTPFSGSVGRLKNVTIATNLRLDAFISWGDGASSTGTIKLVSIGVFQIDGKHTYKYGGNYPVSVSVTGRPVAGPGQVVAMYIIVFPTIESHAIVTGPHAPPAPKPITATGKTLNLTAGQPFTGSVGSFKLNVPATPGVLGAGISWGDGSFSAGTLQKQSDGSYKVIGSHTYQTDGTFAIDVSISSGPPIGPGPQPLFPTRLLGTIHSTAKVVAGPTPPDGTATVINGVLTVRGTEKSDQIDITESSPLILTPLASVKGPLSPLPTQIYVTINGHIHALNATGVKSVTVEGLGGDDVIDLHGTPLPVPIPIGPTPLAVATTGTLATFFPFNSGLRVSALVHGGTGNDTLIGGNANDTLFGDAGNDALNGEQGTDILRGGADNDTLTSSAGLDKAYGGDGEDTAVLAVIPSGIIPLDPPLPFPRVYSFGSIDPDVEHILAPPVVVKPLKT